MSFGVLKRCFAVRQAANRNYSTTAAKNSGGRWYYRSPPDPPNKASLIAAEALGGTMWWWVLWHLWTEPEHLYGAFPTPDPRKWTDAELGIPPDDED